MKNSLKQIVIIGGGFAGINLAKRLAKDNHFKIILIDRNNYHFFPPLIYQVATGFLETSSISYPFRKLFKNTKNIHFRLGTLIKVEPKTNTCYLDNGEIEYDYLVFATGAETNYFGNENIRNNAIPMKNINDALLMRNSLLQNLERAAISEDRAEQQKQLTIVVAGGGPTGVEVSGMLAELRNYVLEREYPEFANLGGDIFLIEGSKRLLAQMSEQSSIDVTNTLLGLGVKIKLNTHVKDFIDGVIYLSNNETIETPNLIWTAGINAAAFEGIPASSLGKGKRMLVDEHNKLLDFDNIYALGDMCLQTSDSAFPTGHPQVAQVAIQHGVNLANNLIAIVQNRPLNPFVYFNKGSMAIIGRKAAVVDLVTPKLHFKGILALFMWLFVHLIGLVTYRNKVRTLYHWLIAYLTKDQSLRMIIRPEKNIT